MTFKEYLAGRRVQDTPAGDLVADLLRDRTLPDITTQEELSAHLTSQRACREAHMIAGSVWRGFVLAQRRRAA